jgi:hypothetical protein
LSAAVGHADSLECVELLVGAGAEIATTDAAQSLLARTRSLAMVEFLLEHGASPQSPSLFAR